MEVIFSLFLNEFHSKVEKSFLPPKRRQALSDNDEVLLLFNYRERARNPK
jgi:hypothetical protein